MEKPVNWLILGDSSGNQALIPEIFNHRLKDNAINLCTIEHLLLLNDVWMLQTYIDKFGPPKNVLLVHSSDVWRQELNPTLMEQIPLDWGFWEEFQPKLTLKSTDRIKILLSRYVPLYSQNDSLFSVMTQMIKHPRGLFKQRFYLKNTGYMPWNHPSPASVEGHTRYLTRVVTENHFKISALNQRALDQIIYLADYHNINVYIANSPTYNGLYNNRYFQIYYKKMQKTLNKNANKSKLVHYIETSFTFPRDQMENANHLIHTAAKIYTNNLIQEIKNIN
jgi:hypothetical protein